MDGPVTFRTEFGTAAKVMAIAASAMIPTALVLFAVNTILVMVLGISLLLAMSMLAGVIVPGYYTRYIFEDDALNIICYTVWKEPPVKYSAVKRIAVRTEWAYVLGYSTRCVAIYYADRKYTCISPVKRDEFVRMLSDRCPQAAVEYDADK